MKSVFSRLICLISFLTAASAIFAGDVPEISNNGYYRFPSLHGETIVFTSEGDLWKVPLSGGVARRLTSHHGMEYNAEISPDGKLIAFSGQYEGSSEVYTIPLDGGVPRRLTWDGADARVHGWSPDGKIIYSTGQYSTLPNRQIALIDPDSGDLDLVPLAQASDGCYTPDGKTLFFTRLPFQGSHTKRYKGGTIQHLWKFTEGGGEAEPLTDDFDGTSKEPMWWQGRIYFLSDRDGTMNIWSIDERGSDLRQHTFHKGLDAAEASLSGGKIVYQVIADIYIYDIEAGSTSPVKIRLSSDFDQMREKWVKDPSRYITAASISPEGDRVAFTARGQVFVVPAEKGRLIRITDSEGVRHRGGTFMPDGKTILFLSDESGELEFHSAPANGKGEEKKLTGDGKVLRYRGVPSPDGKLIAYTDKNYTLWILDYEKKKSRKIDASTFYNFSDLKWSPDSKWLAYTANAENQFSIIKIHSVDSGKTKMLTNDRVDCYDAAWSGDGKWIYFLSDRTFNSSVASPWGPRQPEPFFEKTTKIYMVSLVPGERSPFLPDDEAFLAEQEKMKETQNKEEKKEDKDKKGDTEKGVTVKIDFDGIEGRVEQVPAPAGNYSSLSVNDETLFLLDNSKTGDRKRYLKAIKIEKKDPELKTILEDVSGYDLSRNGKKILVVKNGDYYVIDAGTTAPSKLGEKKVDLSGWSFSLDPRVEWRQMFIEAWRLERDYFYDPELHGVDYDRLLAKYLPYVDRVTDRFELSELIAHLVGELSTLHTFVAGGDRRTPPVNINQGKLGATFEKVKGGGGLRIAHIYRPDPNILTVTSPLAVPGLKISEGDVITAVNGDPVSEHAELYSRLRDKTGREILLTILPAGKKKSYDAIVTPFSPRDENNLRYSEWENERRLIVEDMGRGDIGYVHLRAMGGSNISEWVRDFYPVFDRKGLIIDVRHNRGGNIDSWILERLLRRAWFYWKPRVGKPFWNMQYAFRGHIVVLCNERTASDGEAFAEGFRRLGLGEIIGTRTWGGEVWLSFSNYLVDRGIASAAELGVYGPEGKWLIEGHGVDPDIVVDNLPHETFKGKDSQLEAAIRHLQEKIKKDPVEVPPVPEYPDKSYEH